jgi:hypothetical protein
MSIAHFAKKGKKNFSFFCRNSCSARQDEVLHLVIQTALLRPEIGAEIYKTGVIGPNDEHQTGKAGQ